MEQGKALIDPGAETYLIDDAELDRIEASYPCIWKDPEAEPKLCFIGCPHLSLNQIKDWSEKLRAALESAGRKRVAVPTVFTAAPAVLAEFRKTPAAAFLEKAGVVTSGICPLMYMNNPICGKMPVITNSNKLRTYTSSRYYKDGEILRKISGGANVISGGAK